MDVLNRSNKSPTDCPFHPKPIYRIAKRVHRTPRCMSQPQARFCVPFLLVTVAFEMTAAQTRPDGVAQGPDGSLYITDSQKGKISRVMYTGK
jgi:hypothetical protein